MSMVVDSVIRSECRQSWLVFAVWMKFCAWLVSRLVMAA